MMLTWSRMVKAGLLAMMAPLAACATADTERPLLAATGFAGRFVDNNFDELVDPSGIDAEEAGVVGLAVSRRIAEPIDGLDLEIEAQIVRHFGGQDHWEANIPVIARWNEFPWDTTVDTSAAFGVGLSLASEDPALERQIEGDTSAVMAYWVAELEAGPPGSDWSVVARIHHRSTAFGLFGEDGGANVLVLGLRKRF
ncbi:MAG: hypothetical protein AAFV62_10790 [Pseudomonadota bacterium]